MRGIRVASIIGIMFTAGFILFAVYAAVPAFENLYSGFDAELPTFTQFFFGTYQFVVLLPLVLIGPFMLGLAKRSIAFGSEQALRGYAVRMLLVSIAALIACIVAMYLPIWNMGEAIQAGR